MEAADSDASAPSADADPNFEADRLLMSSANEETSRARRVAGITDGICAAVRRRRLINYGSSKLVKFLGAHSSSALVGTCKQDRLGCKQAWGEGGDFGWRRIREEVSQEHDPASGWDQVFAIIGYFKLGMVHRL